MKKILFIAPSSIPFNGPESICNLKLIQALSDGDFHLDVISKDGFNNLYPSSYDFSAKNVTVTILKVSNKINIKTAFLHLICLIKTGYVYKGAHWAVPAIKAAEELIKQNHYDYIFTRSSPSEIVGLYLSQKYKIRLLVNLNDPFPMESYPFPYGKGIGAKIPIFKRRIIKDIVNFSSYISFPSDRLRDYTLKYFTGLDVGKTIITPHIVQGSEPCKKAFRQDRIFKIVHSGNVSKPRSPYNFLRAMKRIVESGRENLIVDFIGLQDDGFLECVDELSLSSYVFVREPLDYFENLQALQCYDVGLIIEANSLEEGVFLPTKVVDYLQSNLMIASCSPSEGVLSDLYKENLVDYFSDVDSVQSIYEMLLEISDNSEKSWRRNKKEKDVSKMHGKVVIETYKNVLSS